MAAALRGKETELRRLRETMEQNETAIVEVLQERRRSWQTQMTALSSEWERKLRSEQQKAFRTEQTMLMQLLRLQQDNRLLARQRDEASAARDAARENGAAEELRAARSLLDELRWELNERNDELAALSTRAAAAESRAGELERHLAAVRRQNQWTACDGDTACRLRGELELIRAAAERERAEFESERERWLNEKRRVIDYQKQLQLNYLQMAKRNRWLEADIEQLTSEIERNATSGSWTSSSPTANGRSVSGSRLVRVTEESIC